MVRLVPVLIGGTYASSNALLPAQPKNIKALLAERKCYVAAKDTNDKKYLLACRTHPVGKTLDFFYFDSSRRVAVPVKHLKIASGGGRRQG
ncbi:hypothetical protein WEN_01880 [Mycoplasma wenyonii str. Massachusetts]|uniref:Uncharacterized protein n=1 Tax=Mycoplasma wenyonii (strain Massachusetts) TaxID=1197325 RepID=I6YLJ2_MYCWM|nr:hypothetical protein WEN_01880 [Mycoplasma wenyonii str. Massachusetts]